MVVLEVLSKQAFPMQVRAPMDGSLEQPSILLAVSSLQSPFFLYSSKNKQNNDPLLNTVHTIRLRAADAGISIQLSTTSLS